MFLVYDLPEPRLFGEVDPRVSSPSRNGGEQRYRSEFIDKIAEQFTAHPKQKHRGDFGARFSARTSRPTSRSRNARSSPRGLPELGGLRDLASCRCRTSGSTSTRPTRGWLGWDGNRTKIATDLQGGAGRSAGGPDRIRGFATNVANYTSLDGEAEQEARGEQPRPNELTFVRKAQRRASRPSASRTRAS